MKIAVVGTTASGKTTLANVLADRYGVRHVELDALHWGPNWAECPAEEFRARVDAALADTGWVADGSYHGKLLKRTRKQLRSVSSREALTTPFLFRRTWNAA